MTWFSTLTGIQNEIRNNVDALLRVDGVHLISDVNDRRFKIGLLTQPSLSSLRDQSRQGGTIYRNYFVPVLGHNGQSLRRQIDCLDGVGAALQNEENAYWVMKNGYALPKSGGLDRLNTVIGDMSPDEVNHLHGLVRVGLHADTEVTLGNTGHCVNKIY